jgi:hypothetical protein
VTDVPKCAYCGDPVDLGAPYWVVERWEGGRCVARGVVSNAGCLIATAHAQRPRDATMTPLATGLLEPVVEHRVVE